METRNEAWKIVIYEKDLGFKIILVRARRFIANLKRAVAVLRTQDHNHLGFMGARVFIARHAKLEVPRIKSL